MRTKSRPWTTALAAGSIPVAFSIMAACCNHLVGSVIDSTAEAAPATAAAAPVQPQVLTVAPTLTAPAATEALASEGLVDFSTRLDRGSVMASGDGLVRMELTIESHHPVSATQRQATDLVVVLDESGSMSGQKIDDARAAAAELLGMLGPEDRFSLVSFDSDTEVRIPLAYATQEDRYSWLRRIAAIDAGGSTEMQQGLAEGAEQHCPVAGRAARTILISDGMPDSRDGLEAQARGFATREIPLTTVGIGTDYDEQLMVNLADAGTGNFYWVEARNDLAAVFSDEFDTARETVASGLQVSLDLGPGVQLVDASGYPTSVAAGRASFDVGSLYASQRRSFWITLRVPTGTVGERPLATAALDWRAPTTGLASLRLEASSIQVVAEQVRFLASIDNEAWGRSVVEEEYNVLRNDVSRAVQAGDLGRAQVAIDDYRDRNRSMNEALDNQAVWDNFEEVDSLEAQVQQQFAGDDQAGRQNYFAKTLNSLAYGSRRSGQAKSY